MNGMNDCVGKPFTSQELWRCLMKYFKPLNWQTLDEAQNVKAENELRRRLITNFVKDNRNKFSEITAALNAGDIKLVHRLAHTLKSNAAQLDQTLLQKAAANIEYQLKDGKNLVSPKQLAALETELNATLAELSPLINDTPPPPPSAIQGEPVNTEFAKELFVKLEPMLEMGSLESREYIDSLSMIPGTEQLRQQIDDFDFTEALVTLAELRKKI
jgi:HPt (histidine-containing phosphotransfer) domain-containing protein